MKKAFCLLFALGAVLAAAPLQAADGWAPASDQTSQSNSQDHNWTGFYGGVNGGMATSNDGTTSPSAQPGSLMPLSKTNDPFSR